MPAINDILDQTRRPTATFCSRRLAALKAVIRPISWLQCLSLAFAMSLGLPCLAEPLIVSIAPSYPEPVPQFINLLPERKEKKLRTDDEPEETQTETPDEVVPSKQEVWQKVFDYISRETQLKLKFEPATSQLDFELKLAKSYYDLALVTPMQFEAFRENPGYQPQVKRKAQPIRSIIFVKKNSRIKTFADLRDATIAFPNPLNFESSIVPRESLKRLNFDIVPQFLSSESAVYKEVIQEKYIAGAGTHENFRAQPIEIQSGLRIIWDSPGFSPHPLVAHPRVDFFSLIKIKRAFVDMIKNEETRAWLPYIFVDNGFEVARSSDWDEIKLIDLSALNANLSSTQVQAD